MRTTGYYAQREALLKTKSKDLQFPQSKLSEEMLVEVSKSCQTGWGRRNPS